MDFLLLTCLFYLFRHVSGQKSLQYSLVGKFYVQSQPSTTIYSCSRSKTCCAVACTGHSICEFFSFSRDEDICRLYGQLWTTNLPTVYNSSWSTYKKANNVESATISTQPPGCVGDQTTSGNGWTVFQRRQDGSVSFLRNYAEYVQGFGNPSGEFWLGLERMYQLLSCGSYELRVDLNDFEGNTAFATYSNFWLGHATTGYVLHLGNFTDGNADSLMYHNEMPFTAQDNMTSCTQLYKSAWWYNTCYVSNLNGKYYAGYYTGDRDGIEWQSFRCCPYSLKFTEMRFRRTP